MWDRGLCLYELSRYEDAAESFSQAVRLRPSDAVAHLYYGLSLHWLKRYEEAVAIFNTAVSLAPRSLRARFWRSLAYFNLGRDEDALGSFDDLLAAETDDPLAKYIRPLAHICKFEVLAWTGKTDLAVNEWNLGLDLWRAGLSDGCPTEDEKRGWDSSVSRILTVLAEREDLREFVRRHISQFGLEEQMFPLARALDFLLSGDSSFVDRLSPEVKGVTQDIISKLQRAGEAHKEGRPGTEG